MTHKRLTYGLQSILIVGLLAEIWSQQWFNAVITSIIISITFAPLLLEKKLHVYIPPEFVLLSICFVFASLFLGEVHGYYTRFWWWDIALHTGSGVLLGIFGFLLVHILNETEKIGVFMKPGFVAFFAFLFAVGVGTLWEILEFSMDSFFGMDMQKEMMGDPSGLTDTMWDLIVDTIGALVMSVLGYGFIKTAKNESFLEQWIIRFIRGNPRLFRRKKPHN